VGEGKKGLKERWTSYGVNQEEGGKGEEEGLGEGLEKSKEWVCLLVQDLRGKRQKWVGALKGELE
jgi:hypothetical protein